MKTAQKQDYFPHFCTTPHTIFARREKFYFHFHPHLR